MKTKKVLTVLLAVMMGVSALFAQGTKESEIGRAHV